jgi:SAM-dependent methyltransferase
MASHFGPGQRLLARLLRSTLLVDNAYRRFDRLRSAAVSRLAPGSFLDCYNDLAYGRTDFYHPGDTGGRQGLFRWEEAAVSRYFPAPPARVLVGGAGGGREAFALAKLGYEVVAFEPSPALVRLMAAHSSNGDGVQPYRARYQDLPRLRPADRRGPAVDLATLGVFGASILGWSSFSHLRTDEDRVRTLQFFKKATTGPVLVSFFSSPPASGTSKARGIRRFLPRRYPVKPGDFFSIQIGYYHAFTADELHDLAGRAGLRIDHLDFDGTWSHAVMV